MDQQRLYFTSLIGRHLAEVLDANESEFDVVRAPYSGACQRGCVWGVFVLRTSSADVCCCPACLDDSCVFVLRYEVCRAHSSRSTKTCFCCGQSCSFALSAAPQTAHVVVEGLRFALRRAREQKFSYDVCLIMGGTNDLADVDAGAVTCDQVAASIATLHQVSERVSGWVSE